MGKEIKSWCRKISFGAVLLFCIPMTYAQTSVVVLPEDPPSTHLYHASEGNLFFEKYQSAELIAELQTFARETGFAVYVVTVNSPDKLVFENMRQQIKLKWSHSRDCMVIFYDLDTRLLAVQFEQMHHLPEGMIAASILSGVSEQTWISFIDGWLQAHRQADGLDVQKSSSFFREFLSFLRQQMAEAQQVEPHPWGLYSGLAAFVLVGFVLFYRLTKKSVQAVRYEFPSLRMNHRLKARFGGGVMGVSHFDSPGPSRR
jgi:hypothetical protein